MAFVYFTHLFTFLNKVGFQSTGIAWTQTWCKVGRYCVPPPFFLFIGGLGVGLMNSGELGTFFDFLFKRVTTRANFSLMLYIWMDEWMDGLL
jgi:hypothetical protein